MNKFLLAAMLAAAASAHAAGVKLLAPVGYAPGAPVEAKVRDVCKPDERLALDIAGELAGSTPSTAVEVVRVNIVGVAGGDASWSGPKAISRRWRSGRPASPTASVRTRRKSAGARRSGMGFARTSQKPVGAAGSIPP